jgi:hypothetical protein
MLGLLACRSKMVARHTLLLQVARVNLESLEAKVSARRRVGKSEGHQSRAFSAESEIFRGDADCSTARYAGKGTLMS